MKKWGNQQQNVQPQQPVNTFDSLLFVLLVWLKMSSRLKADAETDQDAKMRNQNQNQHCSTNEWAQHCLRCSLQMQIICIKDCWRPPHFVVFVVLPFSVRIKCKIILHGGRRQHFNACTLRKKGEIEAERKNSVNIHSFAFVWLEAGMIMEMRMSVNLMSAIVILIITSHHKMYLT